MPAPRLRLRLLPPFFPLVVFAREGDIEPLATLANDKGTGLRMPVSIRRPNARNSDGAPAKCNPAAAGAMVLVSDDEEDEEEEEDEEDEDEEEEEDEEADEDEAEDEEATGNCQKESPFPTNAPTPGDIDGNWFKSNVGALAALVALAALAALAAL